MRGPFRPAIHAFQAFRTRAGSAALRRGRVGISRHAPFLSPLRCPRVGCGDGRRRRLAHGSRSRPGQRTLLRPGNRALHLHGGQQIALYDEKFPDLFRWAGEVNLIKGALLPRQHEPATMQDIGEWAPFMGELERRGIPITIHADLGTDAEPTRHPLRIRLGGLTPSIDHLSAQRLRMSVTPVRTDAYRHWGSEERACLIRGN